MAVKSPDGNPKSYQVGYFPKKVRTDIPFNHCKSLWGGSKNCWLIIEKTEISHGLILISLISLPEKFHCIPSAYLTVRHGQSPCFIGKQSINGPFSMAMLNTRG